MDTSQAHLSSKSGTQAKDTSKPENLSKDELTAVLKYGAQKMYVLPIITGFTDEIANLEILQVRQG